MRSRLFVGLLLAASLERASTALPTSVGPEAVWVMPSDFVRRLHAACDALAGAKFGPCFRSQMQKAGAPPAALDFAAMTGDQGYLRAFREAGRVDVAYAEYPFRANENQVCLLVNGTPPVIDVDDLSGFDRKALEANRNYSAIAASFPKTDIFPGPRGNARGPSALLLKNGGQRFVVTYLLKDGCRACRLVGEAQLRFDFDVEGRFQGIAIERVGERYSRGHRD